MKYFEIMTGCLRIPVKILALLDVVLTVLSMVLILTIIQDVYHVTPTLTQEKSVVKKELPEHLIKDDSWMTNNGLTFEEKSKLMELEQEKWRKRVNFEREESSSPISSLSAIPFLALWVIFAMLLLAIEFLALFMAIRLLLSTKTKAHRNDTLRTIKFWMIPALLLTILSIADFLIRQAHYSHHLFQLEIANIAFRPAAIILVGLYFWQVSTQRLPGDSDGDGDGAGERFQGVSEPEGPKYRPYEYPMGQFTPGTIIQEPGQYPGGNGHGEGQPPMVQGPGGWTVPSAPAPDAQPPPYSRY